MVIEREAAFRAAVAVTAFVLVSDLALLKFLFASIQGFETQTFFFEAFTGFLAHVYERPPIEVLAFAGEQAL